MNKIHGLSNITTLPELDIFSLPPTQMSIEKNLVTEHRPISVLDSKSIIEFNLTSGVDEYIQLKDTLLYMKIKIDIQRKTGTGNITEAEWKKIAPVDNLLHSLFKSINLEIEGKSLTINPQTYAYKAYFETLLGCTKEAKASHLESQGWIHDMSVAQHSISEKKSLFIRPENSTTKPIPTDGSGKSIDLLGKLYLDLAQQPKPLIGGLKIKLSLLPNDAKFYLFNPDDNLIPKVTFQAAALYVTRSKLTYPIVEAHNLALTKGTAKYPITRGYVKSFTVNSGALDISIDNVFTGQLPRRMFVALVNNEAFLGKLKENPYNFKKFDLNYLISSIDGIQYPCIAYTPDYKNELYVREFLGLYEALDLVSSDSTLDIDRTDYITGHTIYGFTFGNDMCQDCHKAGYVNLIKQGSVGLHLKFETALPSNINVLCYGEFDNLVEFDATRIPITDFV